MKLFEVRDVVREHVGRDRISDPVLDWAVRRGLRSLEQHGNFYWMEKTASFLVQEDVQDYTLASIFMDDYKESEGLYLSDRSADDPRWFEVIGPEVLADTKPNFAETDSGQPAFFTLRDESDEPTISLWPPLPEQDYAAEWSYYRWTELPVSAQSSEHEVLRRWPDALIYLATEQAIMVSTKDPEAAMYWKALFINPNPAISTEYHRLKLYSEQRKKRKRHDGRPTSGNTTLANRSAAAAKAWF